MWCGVYDRFFNCIPRCGVIITAACWAADYDQITALEDINLFGSERLCLHGCVFALNFIPRIFQQVDKPLIWIDTEAVLNFAGDPDYFCSLCWICRHKSGEKQSKEDNTNNMFHLWPPFCSLKPLLESEKASFSLLTRTTWYNKNLVKS